MPHNPRVQELCGRFDRREIDRQQFLERCSQHVAHEIGCSRVGIWMFIETGNGRVLRCLSMYDAVRNRWVRAQEENGPQVDDYFNALTHAGHVVASDVRSHPATARFFQNHWRDSGVHSLLAASFSVNGKLFGAFTCIQTAEPMEWNARQLAALKEISARSSLALSGASTAAALSTMPGAL
jgi:GAF domain-containing protein